LQLSPTLCRGARALLGWTIEELASVAGVGVSTIISFEGGQRSPIRANLEAISRALAGAGIIFVDMGGPEPGLRLNRIAKTLQALLLVCKFPGTPDYRLRRGKEVVLGFHSDALQFYGSRIGASHAAWTKIKLAVQSDMQDFRERIDWEIARRENDRRQARNEIEFLELIANHLRETPYVLA
jgi:transcriptional regulator with XRE-family HTH domain